MQPIIDETVEAELKGAEEYLPGAAKGFTANGIKVSTQLSRVVVDDELIDVAMVATHGCSWVSRTIVGSVADHLIRYSGKLVLVISHRDSADWLTRAGPEREDQGLDRYRNDLADPHRLSYIDVVEVANLDAIYADDSSVELDLLFQDATE